MWKLPKICVTAISLCIPLSACELQAHASSVLGFRLHSTTGCLTTLSSCSPSSTAFDPPRFWTFMLRIILRLIAPNSAQKSRKLTDHLEIFQTSWKSVQKKCCKSLFFGSELGVSEILEKNDWMPINRYLSNHWQNYRYRKLKFWDYQTIIDIRKCTKFGQINSWKAWLSFHSMKR